MITKFITPTTMSIAMLLGVIVSGYFYYSNKVSGLESELAEMEVEKLKAEIAIGRQNTAISKLKLSDKDKRKLADVTRELDKNTNNTIYTLEQELKKDSSDSNVLLLLNDLLKEYANE